ncbi:hypothetical protein SAMN05421810_10564 [Amycolatopsis arida]|uniref:Uncharacterized protein n=1 Tax=Amycolatopsis arida TaxID=587909 RepID=A0A1I5WE88_9PSEU|nr:hypothetical protein [Amycolatopsis arida]TDX92238.1 hypothetical protein CLV69_10583 [Amycolatopsis arida]SFQ18029.1 hypothetical protein SAMN05421810_10564 [Amycolatopsis arida]
MRLATRVVMMHQGGWDEIAIVAGPVLVIAVLIAVARRQRPPEDEDDSAAGGEGADNPEDPEDGR